MRIIKDLIKVVAKQCGYTIIRIESLEKQLGQIQEDAERAEAMKADAEQRAAAEIAMKEDYEIVDCHLCGSQAYDEVYPNIVKCRQCGLIYVRERLREAAAQRFYQVEYDKLARKSNYLSVATPVTQDEMDAVLPHKEIELRCFLRHLPFPEPGLFLEIGCGWGATLMAAQKAGYRTLGFELSADNVAFANQHGLNVTSRPFLDETIPPDSVDCVCLIHVLEHLHRPVATIEKIHKILKPGGICYCGVPNFDCYWHELTGKNWPHLDTRAHLYHFTAQTLSRLFTIKKFDLLDVMTISVRDFTAGPRQDSPFEFPFKSQEQLLLEAVQCTQSARGEALSVIARK